MNNPYYEAHKHRGFVFKSFRNGSVSETITNIYNRCKEFLIPFMQNDVVQYGIHSHLQTVGRYDVNSSMNWCMTEQEKIEAKKIYAGIRNEEWPFFIKNIQIAIVVSKSGKYITLVCEGEKVDGWKRMPQSSDFYLGRWVKIEETIEIIKSLNSKL